MSNPLDPREAMEEIRRHALEICGDMTSGAPAAGRARKIISIADYWISFGNVAAVQKRGREIEIGADGFCTCSCADPCPLGKAGSANRCTWPELERARIPTRPAIRST